MTRPFHYQILLACLFGSSSVAAQQSKGAVDAWRVPFQSGEVSEPVSNDKVWLLLPPRLPIDSVVMADRDSRPEVKLDLPITPGPFEPTWTPSNATILAHRTGCARPNSASGCISALRLRA